MSIFPLFKSMGSASIFLGKRVWHDEGEKYRPIFKFFDRINRAWWKLRYRFDPRHQYHLVNTGLKPDYYDIDTIMLHANMELLCRYVDKEYEGPEKLQARIDWLIAAEKEDPELNEGLSNHAKSDIEALRIYNWWKHERQANEDKHDEMLRLRYSQPIQWKDVEGEGMEGYKEMIVPEAPEGAPSSQEIWDYEQKLRDDETNNLISLMKIRETLWT